MDYLDTLEGIYLDTMIFIKEWANTRKTTIPHAQVLTVVSQKNNYKKWQVRNALRVLITQGYIRKAYNDRQNRTYYVMTRNI